MRTVFSGLLPKGKEKGKMVSASGAAKGNQRWWCWYTYRPKVTPSDMVRWSGTTGKAGPSWPLRLMTMIWANMAEIRDKNVKNFAKKNLLHSPPPLLLRVNFGKGKG